MNIEKLQSLVDKCTIREDCEVGNNSFYGNYFSPYYHLMKLLPSNYSSCVAVELGVEKARGSYSLLSGGTISTLVIGIDNNKTKEAEELARVNPNFIYLVQPSMSVPEDLLKNKTISILHVDTEHSYATAQSEFNAYKRYLGVGSVVLFDDTHAQEDSVLKFVNELPYPKIIDDRLHPTCGYAVVLIDRL